MNLQCVFSSIKVNCGIKRNSANFVDFVHYSLLSQNFNPTKALLYAHIDTILIHKLCFLPSACCWMQRFPSKPDTDQLRVDLTTTKTKINISYI